MKKFLVPLMNYSLVVVTLLLTSSDIFAEDIDLYLPSASNSSNRPQVLFILDTSTSMGSLETKDWGGDKYEYLDPDAKAGQARQVIIDMIADNPGVDFALQIFNKQSSSRDKNGGRILFGFKDLSDSTEGVANREELNLLLFNPGPSYSNGNHDGNNYSVFRAGGTPLCETLYETYSYLSGDNVLYGTEEPYYKVRYSTDISYLSSHTSSDPNYPHYPDYPKYTRPAPDTSGTTIKNGKYVSPFKDALCNKEITIIYLSDGRPTSDTDADGKIKTLTGVNSGYADMNGNFLPVLAKFMREKDWIIDTPNKIKGSIKLHTIGFGARIVNDGDAKNYLTDTATNGGGSYYPATTATDLSAALDVIIDDILTNASLTSTSVAANNFDRTKTLDYVYYSMFSPSSTVRWQGNLKKYKVVGGIQKGKSGKVAIDPVTGNFSDTVTSYWSSGVDGNNVEKGGVAEMLRNLSPSARTFYSDTGSGGSIEGFTENNVETLYDTNEKLAVAFGLTVVDSSSVTDNEVSEVPNYIKWAKGVDVDNEDEDNSTTDMRFDVFGDPLHSKPIVINYGGTVGLRIVVGTNAGVLHLFKDSGNAVSEEWAFMPKELFKNIKALRQNYTGGKVYGVDGEITLHLDDKNGDGQITGSDTAWIFFGLRRGGDSYYGIDVSNPASPSLLWHKKLPGGGQSWSKPTVGYSKVNFSSGAASPVLFMGGGYDTNKDSNSTGDSKGIGVYMLDAKTGTLKWSMRPTGGTTSYGGTDSIPSSIGTLDSDGDGLVDRLYAGDTGGNIWRADLVGSATANWSVFKLAELAEAGIDKKRRFYYAPSIVSTFITETIETTVVTNGVSSTVKVHQEKPYDAILIGSGDRSNPLGVVSKDRLYMIKDDHIVTKIFGTAASPYPAVISNSNLYNYTSDPFQPYQKATLTVAERAALESLQVAVSKESGWYIGLEKSGEKSTSSPIVIHGVAYFTSYNPLASGANVCSVASGEGWLYAVDLALGTSVFNWKTNTADNRGDRITSVGEQFVGSPTIIVVDKNNGTGPTVDIVGKLIVGRKMIDVNSMPQTKRTNLYVTE